MKYCFSVPVVGPHFSVWRSIVLLVQKGQWFGSWLNNLYKMKGKMFVADVTYAVH